MRIVRGLGRGEEVTQVRSKPTQLELEAAKLWECARIVVSRLLSPKRRGLNQATRLVWNGWGREGCVLNPENVVFL